MERRPEERVRVSRSEESETEDYEDYGPFVNDGLDCYSPILLAPRSICRKASDGVIRLRVVVPALEPAIIKSSHVLGRTKPFPLRAGVSFPKIPYSPWRGYTRE